MSVHLILHGGREGAAITLHITGRQPDSGNPTVRDERGACGNVSVRGVGLRATGKRVELPPNPTMVRAPYFYPTRVCALNLNRSPEKILILGVGRSPGNRRRPHTRRAKDERRVPPRGLRQYRDAQRQASNQASDEQGLLGKCATQVPEYGHQCEKRGSNGRVASDRDR